MENLERHLPVMFAECMEALDLRKDGCYVDGTLGGGGHTLGMLDKGAGYVIGIDRDEDAIERVKIRLETFSGRIDYIHDDYKNIKNILNHLNTVGVDGALLDLGVSSYQLDLEDRGFAYSKDGPLDMRMDKSQTLIAYDVVNSYGQQELEKIIREYGEERFAGRISYSIVQERKKQPISHTKELAEIIKKAIPAAKRRTGGNPAKRTFQALRIEVNQELDGLGAAVADFIDVLNPGGRLVIITFHSLEDRIVKNAMKLAQDPCTCPKDFPICVCGKQPLGKMITRKPIIPGEDEMKNNPRSQSAKLRVFEKLK